MDALLPCQKLVEGAEGQLFDDTAVASDRKQIVESLVLLDRLLQRHVGESLVRDDDPVADLELLQEIGYGPLIRHIAGIHLAAYRPLLLHAVCIEEQDVLVAPLGGLSGDLGKRVHSAVVLTEGPVYDHMLVLPHAARFEPHEIGDTGAAPADVPKERRYGAAIQVHTRVHLRQERLLILSGQQMICYASVGRPQNSHDIKAGGVLGVVEEPQMIQHIPVQTVE